MSPTSRSPVAKIALGAALAMMTLMPVRANEAPRVVTDILPVHSLVAQVMDDVGAPDLLVEGVASPHDFALRPSQAAALQDADIVIWVGEELSPALGRAIASLSDGTRVLTLLDVDEVTRLEFREGPLFEHAEHAHAEHAHGEKHDHGEHAHGEDKHDHGHHGHDHDGVDPHAWLDTENAEIWVTAIAARLAEIDPANAETYRANAERAHARVDAAASEVAATLEPVRERRFLVFHDAYHYFEHRFGIEAAGSIAVTDASMPSAARLDELRDFIAETGVNCIFKEPQFDPGLAETVAEGTSARIATLDPLGSGLAPGPEAYGALITGMAGDLAACLATES